ncbi:DegT/DnrJ/EryC1/StrS family aminotransferase [Fodinicurvata sp. EGI_FJ10296]|uniref:DegT/DnrJ/EryC1/StrS family aminotransferase n=1 Tax=Fodinicurvata sp. EGI_FJ10296 TaxID=3231908 RepID=UPI0034564735
MQNPHKKLYLSPPHMSGAELAAVTEAFDTNFIAPAGPMIERFEDFFAEYSGFGHSVALTSGTAALHLALRYLNIGAGDKVIASSMTFIGGIAPILYQGAEPVFIDSDQSWTMDPALLEETLTRLSVAGTQARAIIPTDLYGQPCDLDRIVALGDRFGVPVIVDSAEAVGSHIGDRHAGKGAWAAAYSFNGNKIITTSGGGILATDDTELADRARFLSQQAREPVPHYEHETFGYNYRLSNIAAAIGVGQMSVLPERVAAKRALFDCYVDGLAALPGVSFMPEQPGTQSNRWLTVMLIDPEKAGTDTTTIRLRLENMDIESRPVWKPMHLQPVFASSSVTGGAVSERFFAHGLCLPSGTAMTADDQSRVVEAVRSAFPG